MQHAGTPLPGTPRFAATRWTLVGRAGGADPARARSSLLELCLQYWYPVYTYLRRCSHPPAVADDITAAFFEDLLHARAPLSGAREWPTFREYLLDSLHRFLSTDWRRDAAPADAEISMRPDVAELERRHRDETEAMSPQQAFQRSYALALIAGAHRRLRMEAAHAGREAMFEALAPLLGTQPEAGTLEPLARELATRPLVLAIALKRLRQRFQELVEQELAHTVTGAEAMARERSELLAILQ